MRDPSSVLITGASSGIGAALAEAYARPGKTLFLAGRDEERLAMVAAACDRRGATVHPKIVDVTDREAMDAWIAETDAVTPLELVIANAGISAGTAGGGLETSEQVRRIFAVNLDGVLNTVLPALDRMRSRRLGQIALMSSLAGFRGLPSAPAYCASKAAVKAFGEGLRPAAARHGIRVSVICPGYVRSPMTAANSFPMPFLMDLDKATRRIVEGLARDRARIAFPLPMLATVTLLQALPPRLVDGLLARLPGKSD